jgi:hypothetical protein
MRLSLEQMEPEKDMENFVRDYGTGDAIPDPPAFVNYSSAEAVPSGSSRVTSRPAQFPRSTQRIAPPRQPPPPQEEPFVNTAGIGAIGKKGTADSTGDPLPPSRAQSPSHGSNRGHAQANGNTPVNGQESLSRPTATSQHQPTYQGSSRPQNDPSAEPIDPTAETMLKVGNNVYKVDPTNDPQQQGSSRGIAAPPQNGSIGAAEDPLLKTMAELRKASTTSRHKPSDSQGQNVSRKNTTRGGTSLSPPSSSKNLANTSNATPATRDYRSSAENVVGSFPGSSRPASPNPPTAALMQPPPQNAVSPPLANQPVESVLSDYGRSFPGEGKSISRSNTRHSISMGTTSTSSNQGHGQNLTRPVSREGHPGIGAHGGQSRSTSPAPQPGPGLDRRNSRISPAPSASNHSINRGGSIAQRTASPNSVGIALDPSGKVVNDTMADLYNRQQQSQQPSQYNQAPTAPRNQNRLSSYGVSNNNNIPTQQSAYSGSRPPPAVYQPPPSQQLHGYVPPAPAPVQPQFNQAVYAQPPPSHFPPPPPSQQPVYQPQPQNGGYSGPGMNGTHLSRGPSLTGPYSGQLVSPPHPYGTGGRTPSPQPQIPPTGQFTEDGRGVLFYGELQNLHD